MLDPHVLAPILNDEPFDGCMELMVRAAVPELPIVKTLAILGEPTAW